MAITDHLRYTSSIGKCCSLWPSFSDAREDSHREGRKEIFTQETVSSSGYCRYTHYTYL